MPPDDPSFSRGLSSGILGGIKSYLPNRATFARGQRLSKEPTASIWSMSREVGLTDMARLASATYRGGMSDEERKQTHFLAGKTVGGIAGGMLFGSQIAKGLSWANRNAPSPRAKVAIAAAQVVNAAFTVGVLKQTGGRLNRDLQEQIPGLNDKNLGQASQELQKIPAQTRRVVVQSITSLFEHSASQRKLHGKSSIESLQGSAKSIFERAATGRGGDLF